MANRLSQIPQEVVLVPNAKVQLSQIASEVLCVPNAKVQVSHVAMEVVLPFTPPVVQPFQQYVMT